MGCDSLTKIIIPSSVVNMNGNPFCGWNGKLYNESKAFLYEHQVLFNKDKTTLIAYRSKEKNYIIPNSVTNIGDNAFMYCKSLTSIKIPDGVTNIGSWAFLGCESLTSINIPNSVTNIREETFSSCKSLTSIKIPNSVTNIGSWAFASCESLTCINIPDCVTHISDRTFVGCKKLPSKIKSDIINRFGEEVF